MNSQNQVAKPGRPRRHPVDVYRTRVWIGRLIRATGLTAHALEKLLEPDLEDELNSIRKLRKYKGYETGKRVPKPFLGRPTSVDLAEAKFPGSSNCFNSSIWPLLRGEDVALALLHSELREIPNPVQDILFRSQSGAAWKFDIERASILTAFPSYDALIALLLLMKIGEKLADRELRCTAIETYLEMQPEFAAVPELAPVAVELFDAVDAAFKYWIVGNYQRIEVAIPSNRLRHMHGRVHLGVLWPYLRDARNSIRRS